MIVPNGTRRACQTAGGSGRDRDHRSGAWFLGPETYVLGIAASSRYDLTDDARESVRRLANKTGESAFFSVRRRDEIVVLVREDGDFPIRSHVLSESARFPLGVVSGGLAILAHLPERELNAYFARNDLATRWGPQFEEPSIRDRLAATRRVGWSVNPGHVVEGSWGMAAAVFDKNGLPSAALTLTGIDHRFRAERQPELGRDLLQEAHRLTRLA